MMKKKNAKYNQCLIGRGMSRWMAWVPTTLARVGQVIVPRGESSAMVLEAFRGVTVSHGVLMDLSDAHVHHRDRTDI